MPRLRRVSANEYHTRMVNGGSIFQVVETEQPSSCVGAAESQKDAVPERFSKM